eukprot:EC798019.1.p1 GENE.EC798019.1~~EC798019.1.p1  ORF type:complete len:206 (+),score=40.73 EC798019.1:57-674(+)
MQQAPLDAKIVVLGDTGVGKTCVVTQYTSGSFSADVGPTVGASFLTKKIMLDDRKLSLQLWDTAGQERFRSMAPMYYRGASAAVLVFDVTNAESFRSVQDWVKELKRNVREPMILVIACNKVDLGTERRISFEQADEYAKEIGAKAFETSAKTGKGVAELFFEIAKQLVYGKGGSRSDPSGSKFGSVDLGDKKRHPGSSSGGCKC